VESYFDSSKERGVSTCTRKELEQSNDDDDDDDDDEKENNNKS
jgi:hypothetical protein